MYNYNKVKHIVFFFKSILQTIIIIRYIKYKIYKKIYEILTPQTNQLLFNTLTRCT